MFEKRIVSVSEIVAAELPGNVYSYGFTIQYDNAEISNILRLSPLANDTETLCILNEQRNIILKEIEIRSKP